MRRYQVSGDDDAEPSAERLAEAAQLDRALEAVGSRFSHGYAQRLSVLDLAICAFVDGLRGDEIGPARMLILLKEHLAASVKPSPDIDEFAVKRGIARYYEA